MRWGLLGFIFSLVALVLISIFLKLSPNISDFFPIFIIIFIFGGLIFSLISLVKKEGKKWFAIIGLIIAIILIIFVIYLIYYNLNTNADRHLQNLF